LQSKLGTCLTDRIHNNTRAMLYLIGLGLADEKDITVK
jgi:hypothetical protein